MTFFAVLAASLFGSLHCIGMCGGFVSLYAAQSSGSWSSHLAYNSGRIVTYSILGAFAGALGQALDNVGELVGLQRTAMLFTGVLMIFWGIQAFRKGGGYFHEQGMVSKLLSAPLKGVLGGHGKRTPTVQAFLIGLVTTFLPCGWLYAWVAVAAASGSPLGGVGVMVAFWLGTLPAMVSVGLTVGRLSPRLMELLPRAVPALLIAAGIFSLYSHLAPHDHAHHHRAVDHHHHAH